MKNRLNKVWTAEEDERLSKLTSEGRSATTIGERMKRTPSSIRARALRLKLRLAKIEMNITGCASSSELAEGKGKVTPLRPPSRRWTAREDKRLERLLASGKQQRLIAKKMDRTMAAIEGRMYLLRNRANAKKKGK